ncbi:hypothetical protein DRE_06558 [Drechslerella stenobrocha 248]|uniref:Sm domain-containing protein n=1 Tax=Drechslerella stenobrocha 248 TaxID=1043628 RepID=W7HX25_9PEZI|nr:hypothetical protein DRE_06558 [Drechslerella stenobrocha 248]
MDTSTDHEALLQSFITKTLRVTTKDTRMFVGELKCTDRDANLILARTHEYRVPRFQAEDLGRRINLSSRFLGLVVVMGADIQSIEVDAGRMRRHVDGGLDVGGGGGGGGVSVGAGDGDSTMEV